MIAVVIECEGEIKELNVETADANILLYVEPLELKWKK
jgi:hypothetical protein